MQILVIVCVCFLAISSAFTGLASRTTGRTNVRDLKMIKVGDVAPDFELSNSAG
jgi:hypothetical protein